MYRLFRVALFGIGLTGCSICPCRQLVDHRQANGQPASDRQLLAVPFFPDKTDQCGPSALASVLVFWGHPTDPTILKNEVYLAHLRGAISLDLLLAAQSRGFKAHLYNGSIDDLMTELKKGHPLVAFVNRGFDFFPIGHFVVISGYDEARQGLYVHSGTAKNKFVRYRSFLKNWNKTQRLTLLILPPGHDEGSPHG